MRIIYLSFIYIIFIVLFIPFLLSFLIREIPNNIQPSLEGTQIIFDGVNVVQFFKSEKDNLSGIGMSIKNPYFRNRKDLEFTIYGNNNELLRQGVINGANISDGDLIEIRFPTISGSKNKEYSLGLVSKNTSDSEALEVFLTSKRASWINNLYVNSKKQDQGISLITYHKPINVLMTPIEIFAQLTKRLFADLPFAIFYIVLIGGLTGFLFCLNRNK